MVRVGVVGAGGWGRNLVRNFAGMKGAELTAVCDVNEDVRKTNGKLYPGVRLFGSFDKILEEQGVEALVVATPASTHFDLSRKALKAGKHVFVEKPFTMKSEEAVELAELGEQTGLTVMVGHLLEYHPAVTKLKEMVERGELGKLYYMYTERVNLGIVRKEENAWWSLAPHDISVILYLFNEQPESVSVRGQGFLQEGVEDVAFGNLHFADGRMAQIHVSWLDPRKSRRMVVVGDRRMASFDDMEPSEKIRLFDKGVSVVKDGYASYEESIRLRSGDIMIPAIVLSEPLRVECEHFVECVTKGVRPRSDAQDGLRVVRVLEAGEESLRSGGKPVKIPG